MPTAYRGRRSAAATGAVALSLGLSLGLAAPLATAAGSPPQAAGSPPQYVVGSCLFTDRSVAIATGFEGMYSHHADSTSGCSVVKNTSTDRVLQFWGPGRIDPPTRFADWIGDTRAAQIARRLPPDRVIVLPGEKAVLYEPPPTYYVALAPAPALLGDRVSEGLADLAQMMASRPGPATRLILGPQLRDLINNCAMAADGTWRELREGESLQDIYEEAKLLPACKKAYNYIDPTYGNPDKPPGWQVWRDRLVTFNERWVAQMNDDLARTLTRALGRIPRVG
ncbi:hypothetical protein OG594_36435 [Streptomyces sp. NBC_01214]|uniref:hypothetical protein n=1 Tax=Streptomyces sp. NBC_01214 TaxID=2903777 RepID=UPI00224FC0D6|nr:hypothetical protein [Streptomyces sp. NBC_01214]MCX4804775.1 hypothetical protein [Streptomyces sp. NBC_01214]MCX4807047.1 hypothetical protein [Streptomyces sp. NBC_01214]